MKTHEDDDNEMEDTGEDREVRSMARNIFNRVWPGENMTWAMIEEIVDEIIVVDDDGEIDKDGTAEETDNLIDAKKVAKDFYQGAVDANSPEAAMQAYKVMHSMTTSEKDAIMLVAIESLGKKKKF